MDRRDERPRKTDAPHPSPRDADPPSRFLVLWLILASLLSLGGVAAFVLLFVRDMTVYWFILSPLIIIVYQFPAFVVFRIWKRKRGAMSDEEAAETVPAQDADDGARDAASKDGENGAPGAPAAG